jgi:Na+/glutamate symporter
MTTAVSVDVTSVVIFAVFGIIAGVIIELLLKLIKVPIPYTVLIFYVGIIIGCIINWLDLAVVEFLTLSSVSSELIMYGFLPILLFNETMSLNL